MSNRKPHKNERRLLAAFRVADPPGDLSACLLITGEEELVQRASLEEHGLIQRIVFLGNVTDEQLADYTGTRSGWY